LYDSLKITPKTRGYQVVFNHTNFHLYHYAGNNPIKYTDPDGREDNNPKPIYLGKGRIIGQGFIHSAMDGDINQSKDFLFKKFVFEYMTVVLDEKLESELNKLKENSNKSYSDKSAGGVNKYTNFSRSINADEITYDDLEFSKSTGGDIYYSTDMNPDNFSGERPSSFIFVSKEIDIYMDPETNEIYIENSKLEVLPIE